MCKGSIIWPISLSSPDIGSQQRHLRTHAGQNLGVCASPNGVALPVGPTIPVPTAYFPLTNDSVHSWPIPQYWAYNASAIRAKQTRFVRDEYFGTVIRCNASAGRAARPGQGFLLAAWL